MGGRHYFEPSSLMHARFWGVSDEPLIILKGQSLELREAGGQVVVIQRDTPRDAPAPPDPYEFSDTDFADRGACADLRVRRDRPPFLVFQQYRPISAAPPLRLRVRYRMLICRAGSLWARQSMTLSVISPPSIDALRKAILASIDIPDPRP